MQTNVDRHARTTNYLVTSDDDQGENVVFGTMASAMHLDLVSWAVTHDG